MLADPPPELEHSVVPSQAEEPCGSELVERCTLGALVQSVPPLLAAAQAREAVGPEARRTAAAPQVFLALLLGLSQDGSEAVERELVAYESRTAHPLAERCAIDRSSS